MKSGSRILFRTLLLSTSRLNQYKYCKDKKKRGKIIGSFIGLFILYAILACYSFLTCIGYGKIGIIDASPALCALTISIVAFLFTFFKTNGYLFHFKEYDMLMALPFSPATVAGCKFLYMYIKSVPLYLCISISVMVSYGMYKRPPVAVYPIWLILSFFVPVIPMLCASFVGFIIAKLSSGFRKKNLVQTVLTFVFVLFCMSIQYIIEAIFKNDQVETVLLSIADLTDKACRIYPPAGWFAYAVSYLRISDMALLIGVSVLLFEGIFLLVGRSYRRINSALSSHAAKMRFQMGAQKTRSDVNAIAFKEFKRLTGSTTYMVNGAMGEILAAILGVVVLLFGFDRIIQTVTRGAPLDPKMVYPAIPFIVYFCIGMVATTTCSPSLEGKNYWIVQSLPIEKKVLYQGKILFNLYLTVPFMTFAVLCMGIAARLSFSLLLLQVILGIVLCAFSSTLGCVCGIRFMKLDWENEIEVIKQGMALVVYLFPNMFVNMGIIVLMVVLGRKINTAILMICMTVIVAVLALVCYTCAMKLAEKKQP